MWMNMEVLISYIGYTRVYSPMIWNNAETPPSLTYTNKQIYKG